MPTGSTGSLVTGSTVIFANPAEIASKSSGFSMWSTLRPISAQYSICSAVVLDDDKDGVINELDKCPNTPAGYTVDTNGCTNKINLEVLFENNSAVIKDDTKEKVLAFAKYLKDNKEFKSVITGHASKDKSSATYNQKLSESRANAIKDLLVVNGVESSRIQAVGKGFDEPIASNDTQEGQAKNRRIEAELIKIQK